MEGTKKFQGARIQYTKKVKLFNKIICSTAWPHFIEELSFKMNKDGESIEGEFNIGPNTFSAIWYGLDN